MNTQTMGVAPKTYFAAVDRYDAYRRRHQQLMPAPATAAARSGADLRTEPGPSVEQIRQMAHDYQQAQDFRRNAEHYRDRWFAGRAREITVVTELARAGDKRFRRMSAAQLNTIGRVRWSQSARARSLTGKEQRTMHWAQIYLAFAEFELRLLSTSAAARRATEV